MGSRKVVMKRMVMVCLVTMCMAIFAGCASKSESGTASPAASVAPASSTEATPVATDDKVYEIKWHGSFQLETAADSYVQKEIEKKFNVKITIVNANMDKLKLMAASNDLPDVIRLADPADVSSFANTGSTLELSQELLAAQAPEVVKAINDTAPTLWGLTSINSKNYGIPQYMTIVPWDTAMTWRKDVLDAAGITAVPTTVAEYDAAFKTITEKKKDIIAATNPALKNLYMFSSADIAAPFLQFSWLFGAYGSMAGSWQLDAAGNVARGETLPGTKDALAKLAEWYKAGYIDPAFVTDKGQQAEAKYKTGSIVLKTKGFSDVAATTPDDLQ